jgi:hypothetical protein
MRSLREPEVAHREAEVPRADIAAGEARAVRPLDQARVPVHRES